MICDARLKNKDNVIDVEDYKFVNEFQRNNGYNIHIFFIAVNKYGSSKGWLCYRTKTKYHLSVFRDIIGQLLVLFLQ